MGNQSKGLKFSENWSRGQSNQARERPKGSKGGWRRSQGEITKNSQWYQKGFFACDIIWYLSDCYVLGQRDRSNGAKFNKGTGGSAKLLLAT